MIGSLLAIASAFGFAWVSVLVKAGLRTGSAQQALWYSLAVNVITAWPIALLEAVPLTGRATATGLVFLLLAGILSNWVGRGCSFACNDQLGPAYSSALGLTTTGFTVVIALLFLNEYPGAMRLFGVAVLLVGLLIITLPTGAAPTGGRQALPAMGIALGVMAGITYAFGDVFRKLAVAEVPSAVLASALSATVGLVCVSAYHAARGGLRSLVVVDRRAAFCFSGSGLASTVATITLFWALRTAPVGLASALYNTKLIFAVVLSRLLLPGSEPLTRQFLIGAALSAAGGALILG